MTPVINNTSTDSDAKSQFLVSPMILIIHSNVSYLSKSEAPLEAGGISYLSITYYPTVPAPTNGTIYITSVIL
jgi:hypothetical protein